MKIYNKEPKDWRDLQDKVADILAGMDFETKVEEEIKTVRGNNSVDVFGKYTKSNPNEIVLVECKQWNSRVPKTVVQSFRTVVTDFGANVGYIISKKGFQSGAYEAADKSNVHLMTFEEFQKNFATRYLSTQVDNLVKVGYPFRKYVNWSESFSEKEMQKFSPAKQKLHSNLQMKYDSISMLALIHNYKNILTGQLDIESVDWTIAQASVHIPKARKFNCYSNYFNYMIKFFKSGLKEFDDLFGKELRKWED